MGLHVHLGPADGPDRAAVLDDGTIELEAPSARLQGVALPVVGEIPVQFIQALPYIVTVVLLAGFIGRAVAPKASGIPYIKER